MKLWGGRFTKETNQLVHSFNESLSFDSRLFRQDIRGSIAHVTMLAKQGILTNTERDLILEGLNSILADMESGALQPDLQYEDIHSFIEANLIERVGDVGKKLHTGRSRNDQVALDMKLYVRDEIRCTEHRNYESDGYAGDHYEGECSHLHARLHASAEGSADDAGASFRRLL